VVLHPDASNDPGPTIAPTHCRDIGGPAEDVRWSIDDWTPVTAWICPCNFAAMNDPRHMTAYLADRSLPSWMDSTTRLVQAGRQRGEIRSDYALAAVALPAWAMSTHRKTELGRPPGDWAGASRSLGDLAVEVRVAGMRSQPHARRALGGAYDDTFTISVRSQGV
jgi:hypothetical protein